jgi:hypothetical protein
MLDLALQQAFGFKIREAQASLHHGSNGVQSCPAYSRLSIHFAFRAVLQRVKEAHNVIDVDE